MAKVCYSCGKGPAFGNSRSHSMVATRRRFNPNLQKVRIDDGGRPRRVYVCTRCLKSGKVVKAAYTELAARRQEVNDLNVFPVADGDTGDNMALTMQAVMTELDQLDGEPIPADRDALVQAVARAALMGARGNSGVILSQIVRGAAEELASRPGELVDPVLVAAAFARAADAAYESVRDPAEGTMLTVFREMAHSIARQLAHLEAGRQRLGSGVSDEQQDAVLAEVL